MVGDEVPVFFYGGLINSKMQEKVGLVATDATHMLLHGYALTFEPYVNLRPSPSDHVHGLVMNVSHAMLETVYGHLAVKYYPYPVICTTLDGAMRPALCYLAPHMEFGPLDNVHIENLAEAAELCGFPSDYVAKVRSFLSS